MIDPPPPHHRLRRPAAPGRARRARRGAGCRDQRHRSRHRRRARRGAPRAAEPHGLRVVNGIEITAVEEGRDVHVLGYFFDPRRPAWRKFLESSGRARRARARDRRAAARIGFPVDVDPLIEARGRQQAEASAGRRSPTRSSPPATRPIGADAFDRLLGNGRPAFVPRRGPPLPTSSDDRAAGGIASLAHPG